MKSAQTNIKRPGGLLGCVLSTHTVSRVCLSRVFVGYWRDGAAANGKNAYSYLAVMRLNCLKYLDRSFGSVDTSQGSIKFSDSRRSRALSWQPSPTVYLSNYTYALLCLRLLLDSISELGCGWRPLFHPGSLPRTARFRGPQSGRAGDEAGARRQRRVARPDTSVNKQETWAAAAPSRRRTSSFRSRTIRTIF